MKYNSTHKHPYLKKFYKKFIFIKHFVIFRYDNKYKYDKLWKLQMKNINLLIHIED